MTCVQNDGYHVGSMFQVFTHCEKFGGCGNVIWLAFEYDVKVVVFVLMVCFDRLNPITIASIVATFNLVKSKFEKKLLCGGFN